MAAICAWCFNFSPVFYYYTLNPMPDNLALCCGVWSLGTCYHYFNSGKIKYTLISAVFLGIATLVKLPFILFSSFIAGMLILKLKIVKNIYLPALTYCAFLIPAACWYIAVIPKWQNGVISGMLNAKQSTGELLYILWGNMISVFPELIINYGAVCLFLGGIHFIAKNKLYRKKYFPAFLFWGFMLIIYFFYELNMIETVHDYYLFLFLPPVFIITAYGFYQFMLSRRRLLRILAVVCIAALPITAFVRINQRWDIAGPGFNPVLYTDKQVLRNLTAPNDYCIIGNDPSGYIGLYYIDRKGWTYDYDNLDEKLLHYYIDKGAKYLFTDGHIDSKPEIQKHLAEKVFEKATLRVYKLK